MLSVGGYGNASFCYPDLSHFSNVLSIIENSPIDLNKDINSDFQSDKMGAAFSDIPDLSLSEMKAMNDFFAWKFEDIKQQYGCLPKIEKSAALSLGELKKREDRIRKVYIQRQEELVRMEKELACMKKELACMKKELALIKEDLDYYSFLFFGMSAEEVTALSEKVTAIVESAWEYFGLNRAEAQV